MGYLSCRTDYSIGTCRSISSSSPGQSHRGRSKDTHSSASATTSIGVEEDQRDGVGAGILARTASSSYLRVRYFSYRELDSATQNFSTAALLGRGSHGAVYKAVLRSGRTVAVKRPSRRPFPTQTNEVENEIKILSRIQNPRLVNLLGFTQPDGTKEQLLVVELMPNGTLYDLLHSNHRPPSWDRRLRLALQTAKALLSLHSANPPIIHRDVKSANVLLDDRFNARLGDFGLALRGDGDGGEAGGFSSSVRSTPPAGTLGYLDPGYVTPANLSTKTDVFSFGILLLEIISGRKAIDVSYSPPSVVEWAVPLLKKGKISAIFDPRIAPPRDPSSRRQLTLLAASCVRSNLERRPTMGEVVEQLKVSSRTVLAKVWTASYPCSVVDTERTILKLAPESPKVGEEMPVDVRKPSSSCSSPCSSHSSSTGTLPHLRTVKPPESTRPPLRTVGVVNNERKGNHGTNISQLRTLDVSHEYGYNGILKPRRNKKCERIGSRKAFRIEWNQ
ncbi:hypothetical protein HPP92_024754 [Vanilla planifolia]|uniref:Protein kinase domain-containing protein n=1 Tax=Vanilla planifolia TaxID=51239 RepID=A0A835PJB1_VANPL|nr:hypothetical protein HPP92_024754 [Vanilla planifolia]